MATKPIEYLLCAVGGTKSWEYKRCWTLQFHNDLVVKAENKRYFHGPDNSGLGWSEEENVSDNNPKDSFYAKEAMIGRSVRSIRDDAFSFVVTRYERLKSENKEVRLILIGHSRGGFVCLQIASKLNGYKIPVYFLGLFDAVERTIQHSTVKIHSNVKNVRHAIRESFSWKKLWQSRFWMGSTGRGIENQALTKYVEKEFNTSHGGVGGSPSTDSDLLGITDDWSDLIPVFNKKHKFNQTVEFSHYEVNMERVIASSIVYIWMQSEALTLQIPLKGSVTHDVNWSSEQSGSKNLS